MKKVDNRKDVLKFIRYYGISTGDIVLRSQTIYYVYCLWKKTNRLTLKNFTFNLGKIFPMYQKGRYNYFNLSNFPMQLTAKTIKDERTFLSISQPRKPQHGSKKE